MPAVAAERDVLAADLLPLLLAEPAFFQNDRRRHFGHPARFDEDRDVVVVPLEDDGACLDGS